MKTFNIDKMLTVIRNANNYTKREEAKNMLQSLRSNLMKDDIEGFWITYNYYSAHKTDLFDYTVGLMFGSASWEKTPGNEFSIQTIDELIEFCSEE